MKKLNLEDFGFKIVGEEKRFDERGNLIYESNPKGYGYVKKMEYDLNNNLIRYEDSFLELRHMIYNEFNILIEETIFTNGILSNLKTFNESGLLIYDKQLLIDVYVQSWYVYDDKNNLIHYKQDDGKEYWAKFDENKREVLRNYSNGNGWERKYNSNNNIIYQRDFNSNLERYWVYNNNEQLIKYYNSDGQWEVTDYNEDGEIIYNNSSSFGEKWFIEEGILTLINGEYLLSLDIDYHNTLKLEKII